MSIETEVKIRIRELGTFCELLASQNPKTVSERHFEDNYLLDFSDGALGASGRLIRIRQAKGESFLTYKGPSKADGIFKSREELELSMGDGTLALEIFRRIGMRVWFRYQKYRREYELHGVVVSVDETPIGCYAELEGAEKDIRTLAGRIGIPESEFIRLSYYTLYLQECRQEGKPPGNMVF